MPPLRMLLLAVYGMEVVEAGGALARNADAGGRSFAHVLLSRPESRPEVRRAAEHLSVEVSFGEVRMGEVAADRPSKLALVRVLREARPDVVITQDPEHAQHDLDPDRRPAMTLLLESLALAGRAFGAEEMPDLAPLPLPTIYHMTPERPNCVVDVRPVWERKERAMDELRSQMAFSATHFARTLTGDDLEELVPGWHGMEDPYVRGRALHRALDRAGHVHAGAGGHGRLALAEAYRREGPFALDGLPR